MAGGSSRCSLRCSLLFLAFALLFILGFLLFLFGIFGLFFVSDIVKQGIKEKTFLGQQENGEDNLVLKMYRDPPYQITLQIWTVSVQNAKAVVKEGMKPIVVEKGPYTYNVHIHKSNVVFFDNSTRMYYRNQKTYFFDQSLSCPNCNLSDRVTVPSILFQKIVDIALGRNWFERKMIEGILRLYSEGPFIDLSVDELLFAGYADPLVKTLCQSLPEICAKYAIPAKIGLFYGQNGTDDGIYEVNTGIRERNLLATVHSFNGMEANLTDKYWYGPRARMINGTDGELYAPDILDGRNLQIFLGQLCRSFEIEKQERTIDSGIPAFRYSWADSFLSTPVQRSQGFCNPQAPDYFQNSSIQEVGCAPSGLLDLSTCLPGNPRIFWSNAHFRNAPEGIRVQGMATPSDEDRSYFDIEPVTAGVIGVQQKSQLNVGMLRGNLGMTKAMPNLIVPIILINESAKMDAATRGELQLLGNISFYSFNGGIVLVIVGSLFIVAALCFFIKVKFVKKPEEFIRSKDESPVDEPNESTLTTSTRI